MPPPVGRLCQGRHLPRHQNYGEDRAGRTRGQDCLPADSPDVAACSAKALATANGEVGSSAKAGRLLDEQLSTSQELLNTTVARARISGRGTESD